MQNQLQRVALLDNAACVIYVFMLARRATKDFKSAAAEADQTSAPLCSGEGHCGDGRGATGGALQKQQKCGSRKCR